MAADYNDSFWNILHKFLLAVSINHSYLYTHLQLNWYVPDYVYHRYIHLLINCRVWGWLFFKRRKNPIFMKLNARKKVPTDLVRQAIYQDIRIRSKIFSEEDSENRRRWISVSHCILKRNVISGGWDKGQPKQYEVQINAKPMWKSVYNLESSCSIVPLKAVVGDISPTTDERRQVRWSRAVYWAKCIGTGECMTLSESR